MARSGRISGKKEFIWFVCCKVKSNNKKKSKFLTRIPKLKIKKSSSELIMQFELDCPSGMCISITGGVSIGRVCN